MNWIARRLNANSIVKCEGNLKLFYYNCECSLFSVRKVYLYIIRLATGHAVAQSVEALRYKPMVSLEFFVDITHPAALWLCGRIIL